MHLRFVRSSGPGGQHVNKTNTKAILTWSLDDSPYLTERMKQRFRTLHRNRINQSGEVVIQSDSYRDQQRNTQDCYDKLRAMILQAVHRPKPRLKTKPTRSAVEKRLEQKKAHGAKKEMRRTSKVRDY